MMVDEQLMENESVPTQCVAENGVYVHIQPMPDGFWELCVQVELAGTPDDYLVVYRLLDADDELILEHTQLADGQVCGFQVGIETPDLWSPDHPVFYTLEVEKADQTVRVPVGFRTVSLYGNTVVEVNGKQYELTAVDGVVCPAQTDEAKRMAEQYQADGMNLLRVSAQSFIAPLLDACDDIGLMVICTAGAEEERLADIARMVRNHPCVLCWQVKNASEKQRVQREDFLGNAQVFAI